MSGQEEEHEGATVQEVLVEACRRNNTELLTETLEGKSETEVAKLLNETTTVMGNHLYHEAALRGNYEIIDLLLDQTGFECDPVNRMEGDTPLHSVVRWINAEPAAQMEFGNALVEMMLEAGSNPRVRNRGGLTPVQLADPRNQRLRELIQKHEYAMLNAGDFVNEADVATTATVAQDDEDAEFSGSDEDEKAEWERRRRERKRG